MNIWLIIAIYLVSGVVMSIIADKVIKVMEKLAINKYNARSYDILISVEGGRTAAIALIAVIFVFWPIGLPTMVAVVAVKYNKIRKGN